eukprot:scaffold3856_cov26-Tisochrysis_lutea.AAC.1
MMVTMPMYGRYPLARPMTCSLLIQLWLAARMRGVAEGGGVRGGGRRAAAAATRTGVKPAIVDGVVVPFARGFSHAHAPHGLRPRDATGLGWAGRGRVGCTHLDHTVYDGYLAVRHLEYDNVPGAKWRVAHVQKEDVAAVEGGLHASAAGRAHAQGGGGNEGGGI